MLDCKVQTSKTNTYIFGTMLCCIVTSLLVPLLAENRKCLNQEFSKNYPQCLTNLYAFLRLFYKIPIFITLISLLIFNVIARLKISVNFIYLPLSKCVFYSIF